MEPFAHRIKREPGFCGLQMPGNLEQVRVSLYADDTALVITKEDSIPFFFHSVGSLVWHLGQN